MLVITRKVNESIILESEQTGGKPIEIVILEMAKDRVKLGIDAPREIKIIRNELSIAQSSNVEASQAVSKSAISELLKLKK
jgi:carbon storage regulator